jgi:hypothetical protein
VGNSRPGLTSDVKVQPGTMSSGSYPCIVLKETLNMYGVLYCIINEEASVMAHPYPCWLWRALNSGFSDNNNTTCDTF